MADNTTENPGYRVIIETPAGNRYRVQTIHIPDDYPDDRLLSAMALGLRKVADELEIKEFGQRLRRMPEMPVEGAE